jgi:hypothetical protein
MPTIFLDIETVPSGPKPTIDQLKPPAQMKLADTIAKWRNDTIARTEDLDDLYRKRALSYIDGRILCISYAIEKGPIMGLIDDDEEALMTRFEEALLAHDDTIFKRTNTLVGHNALSFDIPYLFLRAAKYRRGNLKSLFSVPRDCLKDTMKMFCVTDRAGYISLTRACAFFGIEGVKDGMSGDQVYDQYLAGNGQGVLEYCMKDVDSLRKLYYRLTYGEIGSE